MGNLTRLISALAGCAAGTLDAIVVDGIVNDWTGLGIAEIADATGDGSVTGPDFVNLRVTNDAYNLYLLVEFAAPVNLRTANMKLLLDADNNPSTGFFAYPGMDFSWDFDRNRGTSTLTSRGDIGRGNLIERMAPDGSSFVHEIAISLEALPAVRAGEPVRLFLIDESSRDRVPDAGTEMSYTATGPLATQPMPIDTKRESGSLRIMNWNVLYDAAFEGTANQAAFRRILIAVQPDIVMLQEVYDTPTETVRQFFQNTLQTKAGTEWQAARNNDCITLSRYPIEASWSTYGNLVSRIDTVDVLGSRLLLANAHLPCCENGESGRISESIGLMNVIEARLAEKIGGTQSIVIGGDLNSGGLAPELIRLTTGSRLLEMASPRHVYEYDQYTWGSLGSSFGSSRLDFLLFDPTTLFRHKAFILDTDLLPEEALQAMHLEANDTFLSDHLPLVFDVRSPNLPEKLQASPMAADGSTESAWWGNINGFHYPYIQQESLGWLRLYESGDGYWAATEWGGWIWTAPQAYPWMWLPRFGQP